METIITAKKVTCDNCGNYIRQPKYHKEMVGLCCFKCFNMPKHKYYEICIFKYFNKIKELEEENGKLRKKLGFQNCPRMPKPDFEFRKKKQSYKDYKSIIKYDYDDEGKILLKFD